MSAEWTFQQAPYELCDVVGLQVQTLKGRKRSQPGKQVPDPDSGITYEADLDFLDHTRREELRPATTALGALKLPAVLANSATWRCRDRCYDTLTV